MGGLIKGPDATPRTSRQYCTEGFKGGTQWAPHYAEKYMNLSDAKEKISSMNITGPGWENLAWTVRDTSVSRHNGGTIKGFS